MRQMRRRSLRPCGGLLLALRRAQPGALTLASPVALPLASLGAGVGYVVYAIIGVFAAARYGLRTEGDVLVNPWLPGRWDGVLAAGMTLYLSVRRAQHSATHAAWAEGTGAGQAAAHAGCVSCAVSSGLRASPASPCPMLHCALTRNAPPALRRVPAAWRR